MSVSKGGLGISNSYCKYSRSTQMLRNCACSELVELKIKRIEKIQLKMLQPDIFSCELGYHLPDSSPQLYHLAYHDNQLQDDQLGHMQNTSPVVQGE